MRCLLVAHDSNPARFDRECPIHLSSRLRMWQLAAEVGISLFTMCSFNPFWRKFNGKNEFHYAWGGEAEIMRTKVNNRRVRTSTRPPPPPPPPLSNISASYCFLQKTRYFVWLDHSLFLSVSRVCSHAFKFSKLSVIACINFVSHFLVTLKEEISLPLHCLYARFPLSWTLVFFFLLLW